MKFSVNNDFFFVFIFLEIKSFTRARSLVPNPNYEFTIVSFSNKLIDFMQLLAMAIFHSTRRLLSCTFVFVTPTKICSLFLVSLKNLSEMQHTRLLVGNHKHLLNFFLVEIV